MAGVRQAAVEAQRVSPLKLVIAAGDAEHARALEPRQLQRKDGNAAGALDQHGVAWLEVSH